MTKNVAHFENVGRKYEKSHFCWLMRYWPLPLKNGAVQIRRIFILPNASRQITKMLSKSWTIFDRVLSLTGTHTPTQTRAHPLKHPRTHPRLCRLFAFCKRQQSAFLVTKRLNKWSNHRCIQDPYFRCYFQR